MRDETDSSPTLPVDGIPGTGSGPMGLPEPGALPTGSREGVDALGQCNGAVPATVRSAAAPPRAIASTVRAVALLFTPDQAGSSGSAKVSLLPTTAEAGVTTGRDALVLGLDPDLLQRTARSMLGVGPGETVALGLDQPRTLALRMGPVDFSQLLRKVREVMDQCAGSPDLLRALGVEDLLYRQVVLMLRPDLFLADRATPPPRPGCNDAVVDTLCARMRAAMSERVTLADLERWSGFCARALQYAFSRRHGCGPMEWLREERLQRARGLLETGRASSVTRLALDCGFSSAGQFTVLYKARFGETPATTLRGAKAG